MRILIACEFSGRVRDAFENRGHDAWSCDLLPTESEQTKKAGKHITGDALNILDYDWDMMIGFPPCTYLTYAGMASWYDEGRAMKRVKAAEFFLRLWDAPIEKICLENPRGIMTKIFRAPDQEIHPYYFGGDREMKRTNFWLKNLPKLYYQLEDDLFGEKTATEPPEPLKIQIRANGELKRRYWHDVKFCDPKRRSTIFLSIANAMAEQWG